MQGPCDKTIQNIIETGNDRCFDEMIRNNDCRELFHHLSSLRNGILCWYPFDPEWKCLEIGAGFGSITGTLIRNMRKVDVVEPDEMKAGSLRIRYKETPVTVFSELPAGMKYDCIVLNGMPDHFKAAFELLSDDGVMLILYEKRPEMENETWAGEQFCYYILPDMLFPQAVYSERELPDERSDRFFFNNAFSDIPAAERESAFRALLKNGQFEKCTDNYLVELRKTPYIGSRVIKAYLSCDRGREHSFIIRFLDNNTVQKLPVYPEGQKALREMYDNLNALESRGISIIEQQYDGKSISMPFVDKPSLLWYLNEYPSETEEIFEMLYQDILKSSELSDDGKFLNTGYIDMVPFNCFFEDGRLAYYDQEFTVTDCPVGYIMFRAIHYTYIHIPKLEEYISKEKLKEKYDVGKNWDEYVSKEESFVRENRNQDIYYRFWE